MRACLLIQLLLFSYVSAHAQLLYGTIFDFDSKETVPGVTILNKRNNSIVLADDKGHFKIGVLAGDTLIFSHTAYRPYTYIVSFFIDRKYETITMMHKEYRLKETTVKSLTKYEQDSIATRELYKQPIRQQPGKVENHYGFGIVSEGLISRWVGNLTGYNKRLKHFQKKLKEDEKQKFIGSRYNMKLVAELTGLEGDSAAHFMYAYPMPYDYARAATDLEIKMWIRNNYKEYTAHKNNK
jgi:hypothetical protein